MLGSGSILRTSQARTTTVQDVADPAGKPRHYSCYDHGMGTRPDHRSPFRTLPVAGMLLCLFSSTHTWASDPYVQANEYLDTYCDRCHNDLRMSGGWSLSDIDVTEIADGQNLEAWEKILRMTRGGEMPPPQRKTQPSDEERTSFAGWLRASLDARAEAAPDPGRATIRRLNRAEYANSVRDLLNLDVDLTEKLPADDSGYGFDNIADVLTVSATLMDRYFAVAGEASQLAVGLAGQTPRLTSYRVPKDGSILNQGVPAYNKRMSSSLPIDSRGGSVFEFYAPQTGTYEVGGFLNANTNNEVDRLAENFYSAPIQLEAGPHQIGMSFRKRYGLDESVQRLRNDTDIVHLPTEPPRTLLLDIVVDGARRHTLEVPSYHMSERYAQQNWPRDVLQIDVSGPFDPQGPGKTPARSHLLTCAPADAASSVAACARQILEPILRRAYRRDVTDNEVNSLVQLVLQASDTQSFSSAIATALQAVLVSPGFLFLIEEPPADAVAGDVYRIDDYAFASRLALFLWSSLPDDALLDAAAAGGLREPAALREQVARMLAAPKADALTQNFAGQWLFLRNLAFHRPDVMMFPDFDVRLRAAMREETERFFDDVLRRNRSALALLDAPYSYLNDRLAAHYGIEGVQGEALRRVPLPEAANRGGVLGHASLLTLTSYGNHTSVVRRGQWILDHLLAAPPPPAPPDVPALVMTDEGRPLNAREQMARHREDPACASCHVKMDPLGLALENYDAVGAFRVMDAGHAIDASAELPDGTEFAGLRGIQSVLRARHQQFAEALTEQLMTYALGRGVVAADRPTIRAIASNAVSDGYPMHDLLLGIIESYAFNYRRVPSS